MPVIRRATPATSWLSAITRLAFSHDPWVFLVAAGCTFLIELLLCVLIIHTEIDWTTYMQQVECYRNGTRDYLHIAGDTGPIVYPAGHLLVYRGLHALTRAGKEIRTAQYLFAGLYCANSLLVMRIYWRSRQASPMILLFLSLTAYRIHSIFVLRLFNDCIAMCVFYIAVNAWIDRRFTIGCVIYSLAVSIKMNVLLFAPALFLILLFNKGFIATVVDIALCGLVQIAVALPFLLHSPLHYLLRAFELGRVFLFEWTVNWRFLPPTLFVDPRFHLLLLGAHLIVLAICACTVWFRSHGGTLRLLQRVKSGFTTSLDGNEMLFALFTANFIGIAFARSLHYQFYVWYFHSLPFLLFVNPSSTARNWRDDEATVQPSGKGFFRFLYHRLSSVASKDISNRPVSNQFFNLSFLLRVGILLGLELCWNTYPSTVFSSGLLHALHLLIFIVVFRNSMGTTVSKRDQ